MAAGLALRLNEKNVLLEVDFFSFLELYEHEGTENSLYLY